MFFCLTNSLATFQMMMNNIFIFSQTDEQHQSVVPRVLDIFWKHHLYLKAEKWTFGQLTVKYLSLILSEGHVEMDPVKVAGIQEWPTPRNVTEVHSFVGFVNFYQHFVQDFSHISKPLHQLMKKRELWWWTEDQQNTFEELKNFITLTPILIHLDQDAPFQLETDASGYATGAVLSQLCNDDKWHPIGFTSESHQSWEEICDSH